MTHAFQEQPMMDSVEVARQITFDDPAALRVRAILQLHPHCTNRMMNTAFGTEAVGTTACLIGIEAGMATHYVARELAALGHDVQVPPTYAKPRVRPNSRGYA